MTRTAAATASVTEAETRCDDRPGRALVRSCVEPDDEDAEAESRHDRQPCSGSDPLAAAAGLARQRHDPCEHEHDAEPLQRRRARFRVPRRR